MVLDTAFGRRMDEIFTADLAHATEITGETFRRRSAIERLAEWGANLLTRLL